MEHQAGQVSKVSLLIRIDPPNIPTRISGVGANPPNSSGTDVRRQLQKSPRESKDVLDQKLKSKKLQIHISEIFKDPPHHPTLQPSCVYASNPATTPPNIHCLKKMLVYTRTLLSGCSIYSTLAVECPLTTPWGSRYIYDICLIPSIY